MFQKLAKRNTQAILRAVKPVNMKHSRCFASATDLSSLQMKNDMYIKRAILNQ